MENVAYFEFLDQLNDFISKDKKNKVIDFIFDDQPSVKDCIESIGPPHTEIEAIFVNNKSVNFNYRITNNDDVKVYPVSSYFESAIKLRPEIKEYKFIVDANVAKMTKYLRMLGFNVHYDFHLPDKEIVNLAEKEERIILSRDIGLLKRKNAVFGYFLRETNIEKQVIEVIKRYNLINKIKPLSICLECNGIIESVSKETIKEKLDNNLLHDFAEFFQCTNCKKVFWKGSHYDTMMKNINNLKNNYEINS